MALTKEEVIDRVEIVGDYKHIQVRKATVIKDNGVELSRSFHRHVVKPDSDTANEDAEVKSIANILHTPAIKTKWANYLKTL